jgi:hypothetical protein
MGARRLTLVTAMFALVPLPGGEGISSLPAREYPAWFQQMPRETGLVTAVGYAPRYHTLAAGAEEAQRDAGEKLALAVTAEVRGEVLLEATSGGQTAYRGASYEEHAAATPTVVVLDTATSGDMTMVLVATRRPRNSTADTQTPFTTDPPDWVNTQPVDADGLVAVGVAPAYFYEHSAWVEAERNARRALAHQAVTRLAKVDRRAGDVAGSITRSGTAAVLRGSQVVARWRDSRRVAVMIVVSEVGALGQP